ncbi:EamA/RhaT family transporter [Castellaniella sp.]|uniref:EamA/RhaT family transporter n=1 Tax=Castellaniella sp. TaxID=1955812 RepID=UPI002AFDF18C|nr:EamA/RhaT family transporter [Castellaniella sp.]
MHTLILSITFSVLVSVFLKLARRCQVRIEQAIAMNYVTACVLCLWLLRPPLESLGQQTPTGWVVLSLLGVLLPAVFLIMATAVRRAGIVLSDTAQRLALIIPILAAFLVFHEALSGLKGLGILMALGALACLLRRPPLQAADTPDTQALSIEQTDDANQTGRRMWLPLLGVWAGYGTIDILFKQMARTGSGFTSTLLLSFILAGVLMGLWLLMRRTQWHARSLLSGILLGALNFSNIYFYIRAHQTYPDNPTLVFAAMNIGVIAIGTLVGAGLFHERLSRTNLAGIGLALAAIVLLFPR